MLPLDSSRFALRTLISHGLRPAELHMAQELQQSRRSCTPLQPGGLHRCLGEVTTRSADRRSLVSCGQVIYRMTSPHSRNWLAKTMLAYSEQYAPIQIMSSGIISLLQNHPAIICVRVLKFSILHSRTLGTLSHALFTEHYPIAAIVLAFY